MEKYQCGKITAPFFKILSTSGLKHRRCSSRHMKVMKSCSHHTLQEPKARMPLDHLAASDPCIFSCSHCEPSPLNLLGFKAKIIDHFLLYLFQWLITLIVINVQLNSGLCLSVVSYRSLHCPSCEVLRGFSPGRCCRDNKVTSPFPFCEENRAL